MSSSSSSSRKVFGGGSGGGSSSSSSSSSNHHHHHHPSSSSSSSFSSAASSSLRKGGTGGGSNGGGNSGSVSNDVNKSDNLLNKLNRREIYGSVYWNGKKNHRLFTRIPGRLAFCLNDVIPESALISGHIFLGFSKCGQFLISYTQTGVDMMSIEDSPLGGEGVKYHYRLHWWSFIPYKRAKKVAEVMLFTNEGAPGNLHLTFCQWSKDSSSSKAVIYGMPSYREKGEPSIDCYVTITTAPSLTGCKECQKVANSYEEDEMAENWNSCVRLSCLKHGLTIHTSYDLLPPHPKFEPRISMKRDGYLVINTGNILHSLQVNFEQLGIPLNDQQQQTQDHKPSLLPSSEMINSYIPTSSSSSSSSSLLLPATQDCKWSEINVGSSEFTLGSFNSPSPVQQHQQNHHSDSENEESTSSSSSIRFYQYRSERRDKVSEFVQQLTCTSPKRGGSSGPSSTSSNNSPSTTSLLTTVTAAEKAYDIEEHDFQSEGIEGNLSWFRRKRLADKKYELTDDDFEGGSPNEKLSTFRKKRALEKEVLRPLSDNNQKETTTPPSEDDELCLELSQIPELLSPGGMVNKQSCFSPKGSTSPPPPPRMHYKFTRRYIEMDDEMTSVITDIEGDEADLDGGKQASSGGFYHSALPLEVHGAGYQFMPMISNSKAEKLSGSCVKVQQRSLDLECYCLDMAQKLCKAADKNYWFCNDYDVEIIDVNEHQVICVAVVLVQATIITKKVSPSQKISALHRRQYQGGFKFVWNMENGSTEIVDSDPLKEIGTTTGTQGTWHPARSISLNLQRQFNLLNNSVKSVNNDSVIGGASLKTIVDSDHLVAIILDNLD